MPETCLWIKPHLLPLTSHRLAGKTDKGKVKGQEVGKLRAALPAGGAGVEGRVWRRSRVCTCWDEGKGWSLEESEQRQPV